MTLSTPRNNARKDSRHQEKNDGTHQRTIHAILGLGEGRPHSMPKPEPQTPATPATKKPIAAAMPPITGMNSTSTDTTQISAGKMDATREHPGLGISSTPEPRSPWVRFTGGCGNLLRLRLSLRGGAGRRIRSTARAAELIVVAHGGATLRTEHRNHPFVS